MKGRTWLILCLLVLLGVVCYKIVFVPTNLTMESTPKTVLAGGSSPVVVRAALINRLGMRIPFDRVAGTFVVSEGADKISILKTAQDEMVFRTKGATGRLVIFYYSRSMSFPVELILDIKGAAVASLF